MLDEKTREYALWYIRDLKAKQVWYEDNNFCVHGYSRNRFSHDMENDCVACENGEERNLYAEAIHRARYSRELKALELLKVLVEAKVPDAQVIAYIKRHFSN